ncbi:MAG: hypothetical protein AB9915_01850 [Candidatus Dojkabacteria bacterium]
MFKKKNIINLLQVSIGEYSIVNVAGWGSVDAVIDSKIIVALNFFVAFSALIAVVLLVIAGYNFITSMGDADKVESAQKGATAAIVGMVIVLISRVLVELIINVVVKNSLG